MTNEVHVHNKNRRPPTHIAVLNGPVHPRHHNGLSHGMSASAPIYPNINLGVPLALPVFSELEQSRGRVSIPTNPAESLFLTQPVETST